MPSVPAAPKIYHIVHVDRLASIIQSGSLLCDAIMANHPNVGSMIGMSDIKARRLQSPLLSRPGLRVGDCVPFYFCPRSIMLYIIHCANHPNLAYRGGQRPIVHLEADLMKSIAWADAQPKRWAFTLSNAGSTYFEDRADASQLDEVNWQAIAATNWSARAVKEGKQAEFLVEQDFPWALVERIGVHSSGIANQVGSVLPQLGHRPRLEILPQWYYGAP